MPTLADISTSASSNHAGAMRFRPQPLAVDGTGPLLVLVAGMDGTGKLFYRQVPQLARRFRVVTYALRDDAPSMDALVGDLAALIRRLAPAGEPAVVVGESFGGTVAMSFALAHPECVRCLVVVNSFPYFQQPFRLRLAVGALQVVPWGAMALVRRLTAFRMHSRFTHPTELRRFLQETRQTTRDGYIGRLRILMRYDVRERLAEIGMPTLFLASERDHLLPAVEQARFMAARVPRSVLRILAGHGHICLIAPNVDLDEILREWENGSAIAR